MIYIISPHLDDAILSLGQTIAHCAEHQRVHVGTVFTGHPPETVATPYDIGCGFQNSNEAMIARNYEDGYALSTLGAIRHAFCYYDQQYRGVPATPTGWPLDEDRLRDSFRSLFTELRAEVFAPLGIGHPDHELVARLVREACPLTVENDLVGITVYEELPYRVLHPEQVTAAFDRIRAEGWSVGDLPLPLGQGARWMKEDAIAKYRSQFPNGADDPCLLVPERCWQIWKELPDAADKGE